MTECSTSQIEFEGLGTRRVTGAFDGGRITSDGGVLLIREVAERGSLLRRFASCFTDHRDADLIEHTVESLISQRVYGLACGYEDLNDHDTLRDDPLLAAASGKADPLGEDRIRERDRGHALAGKSTLNRLELTPSDADASSRYKKIVYHPDRIEAFFVDAYLDAHAQPPDRIILDLDATDDPLYGRQEGRFFHGYYRCYCYLPLYVTCGDFVLASKLRTSDRDGASGAVEEVERIVEHIRSRWPMVKITVRGDSGFAREELMAWCETHSVDYILGLAKNTRLIAEIAAELEAVKAQSEASGTAVRTFKDFRYQTRDSWSRERRVVGKAEHIPGKSNPRFVVTSLSAEAIDARTLYEDEYCARGEMENRIKEQMELFADRTSTATMRANQLRLWFSALAYVLMNEVRRVGLAGTKMAQAQCSTIRTRLLKIGALVRVSVRRVLVSFSSAFPLQDLFAAAIRNIRAAYPMRC
jgi:hypothetical protein